MAKRGSKAKDALVQIDPAQIRFTHSRIRPFFSGCGRRVEDTLADILEGRLRFEDLPFITVIAMEDGEVFFSLNNRRLYVIKQLKARGFLDTVPVRVKSGAESRKLREKYTVDRCSDTAKFLYEVGAGAKADEAEDDEKAGSGEEDSDRAQLNSEAAPDSKGDGSRRTRRGKQHQAEPEEQAAPVITATAKPKRRADKKSKSSKQTTERQSDDTLSSMTLHVSSELLSRNVDMELESHICIAEFIRNACVNLGIDPDTSNGITENVRVFVNGRIFKQKKPKASLAEAGLHDGAEVRIEPL